MNEADTPAATPLDDVPTQTAAASTAAAVNEAATQVREAVAEAAVQVRETLSGATTQARDNFEATARQVRANVDEAASQVAARQSPATRAVVRSPARKRRNFSYLRKGLEKLEDASGLPRSFIAAAILVFSLAYLFFARWSPLFCAVFSFLYPFAMSLIAIEDPGLVANFGGGTDPGRYWLIYWIVYAFFSLVEAVLMPILQFVPWYWFFRCLFVMALFAPFQFNGSQYFYHVYIVPVFHRMF